jgi:hypothetical protein
MKKILLFSVFILILHPVRAQFEIGLFAGGSFYMGDLNPSIPFLQTSLAYGAVGRYNLSSRWSVKVNLYKGILTSDDAVAKFQEERSLEFKSSIWELGNVFEFNFMPYYTGSLKNYWTPYLFGGAALLYHRPKVGNLDLRDYGTEGQNFYGDLPPGETRDKYSYYSFSVPFGMGIKYSFSKRIAVSLEWGMRKTFTDYIDDVSKTYYLDPETVDPNSFEAESIRFSDPNRDHKPMMQRGNSETDDWYSFAGLTITYHINLKNRNKCSDFEEGYQ